MDLERSDPKDSCFVLTLFHLTTSLLLNTISLILFKINKFNSSCNSNCSFPFSSRISTFFTLKSTSSPLNNILVSNSSISFFCLKLILKKVFYWHNLHSVTVYIRICNRKKFKNEEKIISRNKKKSWKMKIKINEEPLDEIKYNFWNLLCFGLNKLFT